VAGMRPISWSPPSTRPGRAAHHLMPDGSRLLFLVLRVRLRRAKRKHPGRSCPASRLVPGCLHITPAMSLGRWVGCVLPCAPRDSPSARGPGSQQSVAQIAAPGGGIPWSRGRNALRCRGDPEATEPSRRTSRRSRPHPAVPGPRRGWPAGPPVGPPAPGGLPADARPLGRTPRR
jgi:hypothetical protein